MKIAIVMPLGEQRGGAEQLLYDLIRTGRDVGEEWLVFFLEDGPLVDATRALDVDVRVVRSGRLRQAHRFAAAVLRMSWIARGEAADVVVGWMWKAHLYGGPTAMLAGVPAMWVQHDKPDGGNLAKRLANLVPARGVITVSKAGQRAQARIWPRRRTILVHPGVALERFDPSALPTPDEARRVLGLPSEGPVIGIVGRLERWKGIHVLVGALPQVLEEHPDAHCVVVGGPHALEPDYPRKLEERIVELGLGDRCTLVGQQRNVPEWMQAMDVVVHASEDEPFGMVVVEAMALGKPVVAADSGGPTEIITNGKDGLLAPYGDEAALASAIHRYLEDPVYATSIGREAQRRAADFSTQRYTQNLIAAIRDVCGARTPSRRSSRRSRRPRGRR